MVRRVAWTVSTRGRDNPVVRHNASPTGRVDASAMMLPMAITRVGAVLTVSEEDLEDLRSRLRATRWPPPWPGASWEAGTDPGELRRLVSHWGSDHDWREREREINALPWHVTTIAGVAVHFLLFEAEQAGALPLVLTNGWPSSFLELVTLARRLANPSRSGGVAADAFTVVVPCLPGFAFTPQQPTLLDATPTHELWHRLLHDELGYDRYGAHGGDLGAGTTARLAQAHPEAVVGIHLLAVADPVTVDPSTVTADEQAYLDELAVWERDEGGYEHQQHTRPLTLAYGLSDSPAGLLGWVLEKYRAWTDSNGELSTRFTDDFVLTQASIYWFTNTISTSFRPYWQHGRDTAGELERVTVPTAVALFPADLVHPPRSWVERTYHVTRYTRMPRGGHFAAHEEPALLADDLAEFFRPLR